MSDLPPIEKFETASGVILYRLPMNVFGSGFIAYAYVVLGAGVPTLIDTGSGFGTAQKICWKALPR